MSEIVLHKCGMSQCGVSFMMQPSLLEKHNVLLETSYLKMTAVIVLVSLNVPHLSTGEDTSVCLQLQYKLSDLKSCCEYYVKSD